MRFLWMCVLASSLVSSIESKAKADTVMFYTSSDCSGDVASVYLINATGRNTVGCVFLWASVGGFLSSYARSMKTDGICIHEVRQSITQGCN